MNIGSTGTNQISLCPQTGLDLVTNSLAPSDKKAKSEDLHAFSEKKCFSGQYEDQKNEEETNLFVKVRSNIAQTDFKIAKVAGMMNLSH